MTDRACEIVLVRHGETSWNVEHRLQGQLMPGPGLTARGCRQAQELAERLRGERFDAIYCSDLLRATQTAAVLVAAWSSIVGSSGGTSAHIAAAAARKAGGEAGSSSGGAASTVAALPPPPTSTAAATAAGAGAGGDLSAGFRTDPRLRERYLGVLQGLTLAEAEWQQPEAFEALHATSSSASCQPEMSHMHPAAPKKRSGTGVPGPHLPETLGDLEARAEAALEDLAARHPGQRLLVVTHGGCLQAVHKRASGGNLSGGRSLNAAIHTIRVEPAQRRCLWSVVRWGDADHLAEVGALRGAFGGGSAG